MPQIQSNFGLYSSCLVGKARRFKVLISFRFQAMRWFAFGQKPDLAPDVLLNS